MGLGVNCRHVLDKVQINYQTLPAHTTYCASTAYALLEEALAEDAATYAGRLAPTGPAL